jgi:iron(III) transport system permease protein
LTDALRRQLLGVPGWWRADPWLVAAFVALAAYLAVFVLYPVILVTAAPSLDDWVRVAATPRWRAATINTLTMVVLSTASSLVLGFVYAFAVTKSRVPGRRLFDVVPLLLLVTPPFVGGLAFILLLGRRGLITSSLLGLDVSIYGWHGLWLAQTLSFFPVAFVILRSTLQAIDPTLEQAARDLGASRVQVLRTVTLPLATPGLLASALFIAIAVLSDFGNPMLIGGRFRVLATEVYTQLTGWAAVGTSAALGLLLLVPAALFFALQQRVQRRTRQRFATVGGRAGSLPPPPPLPLLRWLLLAFCVLVALFVAATYLVVVLGALTRVWGVDPSLTLDHLRGVARHLPELGNSVRFALSAAALCTVLSLLAAYLVHRGGVPLRGVIDLSTLLPAAVPGTLMGVAYVLAFNAPPFRLTGSGAIIVLAMAASYLPVGYRICAAALAQLQPSLDDTARNLGASRMRTLLDVTLPLLRGAATAAFVFCFIQGVGTLSAVIFLVSFDTPLASVSILNLAEQGHWGRAAALASALVGVTFVALTAVRGLVGRGFTSFVER